MPAPLKQKHRVSFFFQWLAVTLFLVSCGANVAQLDAPSNESVQTTTSYPAVIMVVLPQSAGFCTGTFVSPNVVLTASHCALVDGVYTIYTTYGTYTTSQKQNFGSGSVTDVNDIALLIFSQNIASKDAGQIIQIGGPVSPLEQVRLVGFGCDDITTEAGGGVMRTGINQVYDISNYIDLLTPSSWVGQSKILGPINRAGSCFGDSGGPLLKTNAWGNTIAGIVHAGGQTGQNLLSEYTNLNQSDNMNFLRQMESQYSVSLLDPCSFSQVPDSACGAQGASVQIISFLKLLWAKLSSYWVALRSALHF